MILSFHKSSCIKNLSLIIAAFIALAPGISTRASANEVIVVKNSELKPYQEAQQGLMDACDRSVREIKLREGEGPEKILHASPDAVVAIGTAAFKNLQAIKKLPIVYVMTLPAVAAALPNPNISGVSLDLSPETYLSVLKELFPKAQTVALLYDPRFTGAFVGAALKASRSGDLQLLATQVHDSSEVPAVFKELRRKPDVLWLLPDPTVLTPDMIDYVLKYSFQNNIPLFSFAKKYVEMGAVASLENDPYDMGVQAGEIVNAIAAGRSHPIRVYARKSSLTINMKIAKKMGITFSKSILKKGDKFE